MHLASPCSNIETTSRTHDNYLDMHRKHSAKLVITHIFS